MRRPLLGIKNTFERPFSEVLTLIGMIYMRGLQGQAY